MSHPNAVGSPQTTYMTIQALGFALRQSASLVRQASALRIAALAQPASGAGSWKAVRFDWSDEPERLNEFVANGLSPLHRSLPA